MPEAKFTNEEIAANKGQGREKSGSPTGESGLYRHKSGAEIATRFDPLYGNVQAEALIRQGEWEYVGPVPEGYEKVLPTGSQEAENQGNRKGASVGEVKGIQARLDALEAENARLKEQVANPSATAATEEQVKADAAAQVDSGAATGTAAEGTGVLTAPELPKADESKAPEAPADKTNSEKKGK